MRERTGTVSGYGRGPVVRGAGTRGGGIHVVGRAAFPPYPAYPSVAQSAREVGSGPPLSSPSSPFQEKRGYGRNGGQNSFLWAGGPSFGRSSLGGYEDGTRGTAGGAPRPCRPFHRAHAPLVGSGAPTGGFSVWGRRFARAASPFSVVFRALALVGRRSDFSPCSYSSVTPPRAQTLEVGLQIGGTHGPAAP